MPKSFSQTLLLLIIYSQNVCLFLFWDELLHTQHSRPTDFHQVKVKWVPNTVTLTYYSLSLVAHEISSVEAPKGGKFTEEGGRSNNTWMWILNILSKLLIFRHRVLNVFSYRFCIGTMCARLPMAKYSPAITWTPGILRRFVMEMREDPWQ